MVQTMSHTEVLQCSADDIWGACKHADDILPQLMPDFFTKSVFLQGHGEPGSIRIVKLGPAAPLAAEAKERMDIFDDATKTLGYTVLEGDRRYSSFSAQMKFVPAVALQNFTLGFLLPSRSSEMLTSFVTEWETAFCVAVEVLNSGRQTYHLLPHSKPSGCH